MQWATYNPIYEDHNDEEDEILMDLSNVDGKVYDFSDELSNLYFNDEDYDLESPSELDNSFTPTYKTSKKSSISGLERLTIEQLFDKVGLKTINGKKIKFGSNSQRTWGNPKSYHRILDKLTNTASARDISIEGGDKDDYAEFRRILLNTPEIVEYMRIKNWGIINEITPDIRRYTKGTGNHFHFGPDTWAKLTWKKWLESPNIPVTKDLLHYV